MSKSVRKRVTTICCGSGIRGSKMSDNQLTIERDRYGKYHVLNGKCQIAGPYATKKEAESVKKEFDDNWLKSRN